MIEPLIGLGGFFFGIALTLLATRARRAPLDPVGVEGELNADADEDLRAAETRTIPLVGLLGVALREPLRGLRRSESPRDLVAQVERVAWQARMLVSRARPMQAQPTSPAALLQEAAEEVEALRLGKVAISWGLLTRQPVHVDAERTRGAFRELLHAAAEAAGEGARLAIRIHEGKREGYPVEVQIEIGRRGAEYAVLPYRVARHLLEGQGARVDSGGPVVCVALRSLPMIAASG